MIQLHDPAVRDGVRSRIGSLTSTVRPRWGRMSPAQMLWHCNQVFLTSLGENPVTPRRPPFPVGLLKLMLFKLPWPHNAPTAPEYRPDVAREFDAERASCLALIERFTTLDRDAGGWSRAVFGPMSGRDWSCLHARHLDHHLTQFGA